MSCSSRVEIKWMLRPAVVAGCCLPLLKVLVRLRKADWRLGTVNIIVKATGGFVRCQGFSIMFFSLCEVICFSSSANLLEKINKTSSSYVELLVSVGFRAQSTVPRLPGTHWGLRFLFYFSFSTRYNDHVTLFVHTNSYSFTISFTCVQFLL